MSFCIKLDELGFSIYSICGGIMACCSFGGGASNFGSGFRNHDFHAQFGQRECLFERFILLVKTSKNIFTESFINLQGCAVVPLVVAAVYSDSNDSYIPNVELMFVCLGVVGFIVGLYMNYYDAIHGSVLNGVTVPIVEDFTGAPNIRLVPVR